MCLGITHPIKMYGGVEVKFHIFITSYIEINGQLHTQDALS